MPHAQSCCTQIRPYRCLLPILNQAIVKLSFIIKWPCWLGLSALQDLLKVPRNQHQPLGDYWKCNPGNANRASLTNWNYIMLGRSSPGIDSVRFGNPAVVLPLLCCAVVLNHFLIAVPLICVFLLCHGAVSAVCLPTSVSEFHLH